MGSNLTNTEFKVNHSSFRSENCLKNKFYGSIRKLIRKMNVWGKENKMLKKEIKYESVIKPLEFEELVYQHSYGDSIPLRSTHKILFRPKEGHSRCSSRLRFCRR